MNGLGGNHSPLVGLRAQALKHTPREKYVEDGGQTKMMTMNKRSDNVWRDPTD